MNRQIVIGLLLIVAFSSGAWNFLTSENADDVQAVGDLGGAVMSLIAVGAGVRVLIKGLKQRREDAMNSSTLNEVQPPSE